MQALFVIVLALAAGAILLTAVTTARRAQLARRERREAEIAQRLKPPVLAFLNGGTALPAGLTEREQEILADMLGGYARMLRGPVRERISDYFRQQGVTGREERRLAGDRRDWRRAAAAFRLGDIGSAAAAPALIGALADGSRDVRTAAVRSLGRLGSPDAAEGLLSALAARRVPGLLARWSLLQIGPAGLPRLRALASSQEAAERAGALQLIGLLGTASDADLLAARLRDTSAPVREQAATALGRLGGPGSVSGLLAALGDRIPAVRAAAAAALGRLRDRRAAEPLLGHAHGDSFEVAQAAAVALASLDPGLAASESAASLPLAEATDLARLR
jgi:HEAT repeat protein